MKVLRQSETFAFSHARHVLAASPPVRGPLSAQEKEAHLPGWAETRDALRDIGGRYRETPVPLKDGRSTHVYLDPKNVFSSGGHMNNMAKAMLAHADHLGLDYNAIGGPTMGADVISHSMVANHPDPNMGWYTVRDKAKAHGLGKWIEGTEIGPQHNVILTDDVADSGKSLVDAYHKVKESGANVAAVMPLVERGDKAADHFAGLGVPYHPLVHYNDLGIHTLSGGGVSPPPASPPSSAVGPPGAKALANPPRGPMSGYEGAPRPGDGTRGHGNEIKAPYSSPRR
jgi:orotate phosphoribosyltransferase